MAIVARVNGVDMPIIEGDVTWELDVATDFEVEVAAQGFDWARAYNQPIAILENGEVVVSGIVARKPDVEFSGEAATVTLKGMGEFARLVRERARGDAKYQNSPIIGILLDLLPSDWTLRVVNMDDADVTTTIDLRDKSQLFGQVVQAVESVPFFHMRYGGYDGARYVLEVGNFNDVNATLNKGNIVESLRVSPGQNELVREVEAFTRSANATITLEDQVTPGGPNSLAVAHPLFSGYPISQASDGAWVVRNAAVASGNAVRQSFSGVQLESGATAADRNEAGFAVWLQAVQYLIKNSDYEVYEVGAALAQRPIVGDRVRVTLSRAELVRDPALGLYTQMKNTLDLDEDIRIVRVSRDLRTYETVGGLTTEALERVGVYEIEMSSNDQAEIVDGDLLVIEQTQQTTDDGATPKTLNAVASATQTHGVGDVADGVCSPLTAKQFTVTAPAVPGGATSVFTWYEVTPSAARVSITGLPATPGDDWVACIETPGGGWSPSGNVTVTVYFQYL